MKNKNKPPVQDSRSFIENARRAQIVSCAIDAIVELGYARASLDRIAERAGISKGVISYHFASKDELMTQIVTEVFEAGGRFMAPRIIAGATATMRLRSYIESNVEFIGTQRKPLMAVIDIANNARQADGTPLVDAIQLGRRVTALEGMLRAGIEAGEFRKFDPQVMAFAIVRAIDGIPPALMERPDLDLNHFAHELTDLFLSAMRKEKP